MQTHMVPFLLDPMGRAVLISTGIDCQGLSVGIALGLRDQLPFHIAAGDQAIHPSLTTQT